MNYLLVACGLPIIGTFIGYLLCFKAGNVGLRIFGALLMGPSLAFLLAGVFSILTLGKHEPNIGASLGDWILFGFGVGLQPFLVVAGVVIVMGIFGGGNGFTAVKVSENVFEVFPGTSGSGCDLGCLSSFFPLLLLAPYGLLYGIIAYVMSLSGSLQNLSLVVTVVVTILVWIVCIGVIRRKRLDY